MSPFSPFRKTISLGILYNGKLGKAFVCRNHSHDKRLLRYLTEIRHFRTKEIIEDMRGSIFLATTVARLTMMLNKTNKQKDKTNDDDYPNCFSCRKNFCLSPA